MQILSYMFRLFLWRLVCLSVQTHFLDSRSRVALSPGPRKVGESSKTKNLSPKEEVTRATAPTYSECLWNLNFNLKPVMMVSLAFLAFILYSHWVIYIHGSFQLYRQISSRTVCMVFAKGFWIWLVWSNKLHTDSSLFWDIAESLGIHLHTLNHVSAWLKVCCSYSVSQGAW